MNLTIDIGGRANEVQRELKQIFRAEKVLFLFSNFDGLKGWLSKAEKKLFSKSIESLDAFTLILEGLQGHIKNLNEKDAADILGDIRNAIRVYDLVDEKVAELSYINNPILKERLKYLLKTLYRTEALLHLATTKHLPVMRTPDYIKAGLTTMSQEAISKSALVFSDFDGNQLNKVSAEAAQVSFNEFWKDEDDAYWASYLKD